MPIVFYGDLGMDAGFEEGKHPRDNDGKFSTAPGGSGKSEPHPVIKGKLNVLGFKKVAGKEGTTSYVHPSGLKVILHPAKPGKATTKKFSIKGAGGEHASSGYENLAALFKQLVDAQKEKQAETSDPEWGKIPVKTQSLMKQSGFQHVMTTDDYSRFKDDEGNIIRVYNDGSWKFYSNSDEDVIGNDLGKLHKFIEEKSEISSAASAASVVEPEPEKSKPDPVHKISSVLTENKYKLSGSLGHNFGDNKSLIYENDNGAKVEFTPDGQWIASTPGHMTKEGKGPDNLKLLMSGAKPPNPPPWSNSQKVPGQESKQAKKTVHEAAKELFDNLSKKAPAATQTQATALANYTGSYYQSINSKLRLNPSMNSSNDTIKALDSYLEKAEIPEDVTLYRKVDGDFATLLKGVLDVGCVFVEKGYCSSSTDPSTWSGSLHFEINAPKGTKGAGVGKYSSHKSEKEVLLHRHTFMRIDSIDVENGKIKCSVVAQGTLNKQQEQEMKKAA